MVWNVEAFGAIAVQRQRSMKYGKECGGIGGRGSATKTPTSPRYFLALHAVVGCFSQPASLIYLVVMIPVFVCQSVTTEV